MTEEGIQMPLPSTVLQEYLDAGKTAWTRGAMKKRLLNETGTKVECHCQAQILYDHLAAKGLVVPGMVTSDEVEREVSASYDLSKDEVDRGIEINDNLDDEDLRHVQRIQLRSVAERAVGIFEFYQKIAPKYMTRVIEYYRSVGR